jgi:hypothetical protein
MLSPTNPDRAQRMVGRHPRLWRHVTEHVDRLLIVSTHAADRSTGDPACRSSHDSLFSILLESAVKRTPPFAITLGAQSLGPF